MGIVRTVNELAAGALLHIGHDTSHLQSRSARLRIGDFGLDEDIAIVHHRIVLGLAADGDIETAADDSGKAARHRLRAFAFKDDADIVRHVRDGRVLRISDDAGD